MTRFSSTSVAVIATSLCSLTALAFSQTQPPAPTIGVQPHVTQPGTLLPIDPALARLTEALPTLDDKARRGLALQIALDRAGFSPGEIDAAPGINTDRAMTAFRAAKGTTDLGDVYLNPVATYMISADDAAGPFVERIPEDMMEKS